MYLCFPCFCVFYIMFLGNQASWNFLCRDLLLIKQTHVLATILPLCLNILWILRCIKSYKFCWIFNVSKYFLILFLDTLFKSWRICSLSSPIPPPPHTWILQIPASFKYCSVIIFSYICSQCSHCKDDENTSQLCHVIKYDYHSLLAQLPVFSGINLVAVLCA